MRAGFPAIGVWILAAAGVGCGLEVEQRVKGVRTVIQQARKNGAYRCAPRELALAETHADFADDELVYGNHLGAKAELAVADQNAKLAFEHSPPERCLPQPAAPPKKKPKKKAPPADTDHDGIIDTLDKCPTEPEDKDGFEDEDGCPDPDNDKDGVLDKDDKCPNEAGPKENEGCPDGDRDGDKVVDRLDKCPDVPGDPEKDGCPLYKMIVVKEDKIELRQKVHFKTNRFQILPDSYYMLNEVADALVRHPTMEIRIEGHTDARASLKHNMKLSQDRANSVKRYLEQRGIAGTRMEAIGYGPTRPVDDNRSAIGRENNRRVEFLITKQ